MEEVSYEAAVIGRFGIGILYFIHSFYGIKQIMQYDEIFLYITILLLNVLWNPPNWSHAIWPVAILEVDTKEKVCKSGGNENWAGVG